MEAPPNYGRDYTVAFHQVYPRLARESITSRSCRFFCRASPAIERLNQRDGIHPTAEGARIVADNVWAVARADRSTTTGIMIELRERFENGHERLRAAHHSASAVDSRFRADSSSRSSGRRAAASRRCSACIAGLDAPTSGSVLIDGVDITQLDEDALARLRGEKIGFVFQFFHLIPSLTAYENVAVPMEIAGVADARRARASSCSRRSGLTGRGAPLSVAALRRRAAARRARARARQRSADRARRRADRQSRHRERPAHHGAAAGAFTAARGTTLVLVTHDAELAAMADARLVLRDGRVVGPRPITMKFVLRMAVRETRASWRRLLFFFVCIAVGVAAIVALRSVIQSVRDVFGTRGASR